MENDNKRKNTRRPRRQREVKLFEERVVNINRVTKVVKGGRRFRFSALVVIGDKKGKVGFGTGKAQEVPDAIKKAIEDAKRNLIKVPMYGKTITDELKLKLSKIHKGKTPHNKGKTLSQEIRNKISNGVSGSKNPMYGKNHTLETRKKISETRKLKNIPGPIISEEGKTKLRLKRIKEIAEDKYNGHQIVPSYNKSACKVFDNINSALGWDGKHAMNGGEHFLAKLGYWIDYYEPTRNIVIEWDEPHHYNVDGTLKEKDTIRQQQIEECLKCKFFRVKETTFDEPKLIAELKTL